jgi:predicted O-methyltransferase YrrM
MSNTALYHESLSLTEALMNYRHQPIYRRLRRLGKRESMLHPDVLQLIYHFGRISRGAVLEIGAFRGGSTVAAAWGVRDGGKPKRIITIEPGGSLRGHRLATRNILRTLKRNLARAGAAEQVTVLEGRSNEPQIIAAVDHALGTDQIGLLIFDADAGVKRDFECYRDKLRDDCWVVIDDYGGAADNEKRSLTKPQVDELVRTGQLAPLGYYGLSTWVGKSRGITSLHQ